MPAWSTQKLSTWIGQSGFEFLVEKVCNEWFAYIKMGAAYQKIDEGENQGDAQSKCEEFDQVLMETANETREP